MARILAAEAGELLLSVRAGPGWGVELGRRGDQAANRYLVDALRSERPRDAILSEEEADDSARLEAARVWIIDPLDGTREFAEPGRDDWAVHVALWAGGRIAAAAVALPAEGVTLSTADAPPPPPVRPGRR
ncbi:MAG: inositol monophosphatase family protein, partial [Acidimicrobiales bacterium]